MTEGDIERLRWEIDREVHAFRLHLRLALALVFVLGVMIGHVLWGHP
jgi:hypothetical protein